MVRIQISLVSFIINFQHHTAIGKKIERRFRCIKTDRSAQANYEREGAGKVRSDNFL